MSEYFYINVRCDCGKFRVGVCNVTVRDTAELYSFVSCLLVQMCKNVTEVSAGNWNQSYLRENNTNLA